MVEHKSTMKEDQLREPILNEPHPVGPIRDVHLAGWYYKRIQEHVDEFSKELKKDEELSVVLILNDGRNVDVTSFGYHNPDMIIVRGIDQREDEVEVLVPQANLQIVLTKVRTKDLKRKIIGFRGPVP